MRNTPPARKWHENNEWPRHHGAFLYLFLVRVWDMFFPKTLGKKAVGSATAARSALAAAAGASAHSAPSAPLCERHRSCAALRGSGGQRMGCGGSKLEEGGADQGSSSRTDDRGRAGKSVVPARQNGGSDPEAGASFKKVRPERREAYSSGKQALGPSAGPAPSQQPAAAPKSAADMDQLRKSCATIMLFSTMTADQQEKIFEAMFEVRARATCVCVCVLCERPVYVGSSGGQQPMRWRPRATHPRRRARMRAGGEERRARPSRVARASVRGLGGFGGRRARACVAA